MKTLSKIFFLPQFLLPAAIVGSAGIGVIAFCVVVWFLGYKAFRKYVF